MLTFSKIELSDKQEMERYLSVEQARFNERMFTGLYIWSGHYDTKKCIQDGFLYLMASPSYGTLTYYAPTGVGDVAEAMRVIDEDARVRGQDYKVFILSEAQKERIKQAMPDRYDFVFDRDNADYIYLARDLIELEGKRYHSKRNHIRKFDALYDGRWEYRDIDPNRDTDELLAFQRQWCIQKGDPNAEDYRFEHCAIRRALVNYDALAMRGGMIRVDDKLAAFTLASPLTHDTIDIIIEKADADYEGAYAKINQEFAARRCADFEYICREEDMGIEGLRRAKESYKPAFLADKYIAVPKK